MIYTPNQDSIRRTVTPLLFQLRFYHATSTKGVVAMEFGIVRAVLLPFSFLEDNSVSWTVGHSALRIIFPTFPFGFPLCVPFLVHVVVGCLMQLQVIVVSEWFRRSWTIFEFAENIPFGRLSCHYVECAACMTGPVWVRELCISQHLTFFPGSIP